MKFIFFVGLSILSSCQKYDRDEIVNEHNKFMKTIERDLPYVKSLNKSERAIGVAEGYPNFSSSMIVRYYFMKLERYQCILSFSLDLNQGKIIKVNEITLDISEIKRVTLTDSGSVRKSFGSSWSFKDRNQLDRLVEHNWDIELLGIKKQKPLLNSHLVYESWEFLFR